MQEPFHLKSFEAEGEAILDKAREKGREILIRTLRECKNLKEKARETGQEEGVKRAEEAERTRIAAETASLSGLLSEAARQIEEQKKDLVEIAERDLVRLAVAIAGKIVKGEVASGHAVAAANVRRAVELAVSRGTLEILLHPDDHSNIEKYLPELTAEFTDIDSVELRDDPSVERGGCMVNTRIGKIDADLKSQLVEIERTLLGETDTK